MLAVIDIEQARKTIEGVLEAAGDEGRLIVELRYPGE